MSKTLAAAVALASFAAIASADTVNMSFDGTGHGDTARVTSPAGTVNVFAGQLKHSITGGTGVGAQFSGQYITYCADLTQHVGSATNTFQVVGVNELRLGAPMGLAKAEAINRLFTFAAGQEVSPSATNSFAAAFQLAIWEIIYDYSNQNSLASLSVASGSFSATKTNGSPLSSSISSNLNAFFAAAANGPAGTQLLGLGSQSRQDQIIHLPAPGAAALAGMGMLLVGTRRRK